MKKHHLARIWFPLVFALMAWCPSLTLAQEKSDTSTVQQMATDTTDLALDDSLSIVFDSGAAADEAETTGFHQSLKKKFIEGNAGFMSLVALALVLGLAFCIERIVYLSLSEIDAKRFMSDLEAKVADGDVDGAKQQCLETRGPVAAICYQGLLRMGDDVKVSGCQLGERLFMDNTDDSDGAVVGIPGHRHRHGDGFRPHTASGRHQPNHCGSRYESRLDNHHLRYHRSPDFAIVL